MLHADSAHPDAIQGLQVALQGALRGLNHALSNRVAAVAALGACLTSDEPIDAELLQALRAEGDRLERLLHLQRLLGGTSAPAEAVHLPDLVPDVAALYAQQSAMRDLPLEVATDAAVVPVRVRPSALAQAMLAMLGAAAAWARGARGATLLLRTGGDATTTVVSVEARWPVGADAPAGAAAPTVAPQLHAAAWLLADAEARVQLQPLDAGVRVELALPTLLELRRRARATDG